MISLAFLMDCGQRGAGWTLLMGLMRSQSWSGQMIHLHPFSEEGLVVANVLASVFSSPQPVNESWLHFFLLFFIFGKLNSKNNK